MKRVIISTLAIAAAMASCSKEGVVSVGAEQAEFNKIGFSTYSSLNHTKGTPVDRNDQFAVSGQEFTTAAFVNVDGTKLEYLTAIIAHDGNDWNYKTPADAEYWPSDETQTLDFYAHANAAVAPVISSTGIAAASYAIPAAIGDQKDFLYAETLGAQNVNPDADKVVDGSVQLLFQHALTQINVTATVPTDYTLDVESVTFHNVNSQGALQYPLVSPATRIWSGQSTLTSYTIANSGAAITATTGAIDDTNGELILMPQTFAAWNPTTNPSVYTDATNTTIDTSVGAFILVECTLTKTIGGKTIYYIGDKNGAGKTAIPLASVADTGATHDTTSPEWKEGRNITYNLSFNADPTKPGGGKDPETGEDTLVPITFDTDVAVWVPVSAEDIFM